MELGGHHRPARPACRRGGLLLVVLGLQTAWGQAPSDTCRSSLQAIKNCDVRVQAQVACASDALLNNTMLRALLGCGDASPGQCQAKCLDMLGKFGMPVNGTNVECTVQEQLMKQYSGAPKLVFNFVTDPASQLRKPVPLPAALAASGGVPSFSYLGDYQRCLYSSEFQYCLLQGSISAGALSLTSLMGLCRPAECSESAVRDDVALVAAQAGMQDWTLGCRKRTDPDPRIEWTAGQVIALLLFLAILALVAASTFWDLNKKWPAAPADEQRPPAAPAVVAAFQAWSLSRNWASFVRVRPEDPRASLRVLDGLRVLSTAWVILGHTVIWPMLSVMYENAGMVLPPTGRLTETWFQVVPGGYFAVDTFFLLSGFLGARTLHAKVQKQPALLTPRGFCLRLYPMALFARWLRLSLIYAFVLLFTQTWYREIGRGALLWNAGTSIGKGVCITSIDNDSCKSNWWAQLLYVNNIWPRGATNSCMAWSWYLACDMQMFLLVPFLVLMRERLGKGAAWGALVLLNLASVVANIWVIASQKLVTDPVMGNFGGGHFMRDIYEVSWMRVQPYLIGVGLAWVLGALLEGPGGAPKQQARELAGAADASAGPDQELGALARATGPEPLLGPASSGGRAHGHAVVPAAWAVVLQLLSFAAMAFVVFIPVTRYQCESLQACSHVETSPWSETANALYGALNHAVWALGLAGLLLLCFLRAPGTWWVNTLLGAEFWQAPMKLTYSAYLIHPLVIVFFYCQNDTALPYLDTLLFGNFVSFTVIVFLLAFFLWLLVEKPLENVGTQLLKALTGAR